MMIVSMHVFLLMCRQFFLCLGASSYVWTR